MPDPNATVATAWDAMKAWLDKNDSVLYLPDAFFQKQLNKGAEEGIDPAFEWESVNLIVECWTSADRAAPKRVSSGATPQKPLKTLWDLPSSSESDFWMAIVAEDAYSLPGCDFTGLDLKGEREPVKKERVRLWFTTEQPGPKNPKFPDAHSKDRRSDVA